MGFRHLLIEHYLHILRLTLNKITKGSVGFDRCVVSYVHHYDITQNSLATPKNLCASPGHTTSSLWQALIHFLSL